MRVKSSQIITIKIQFSYRNKKYWRSLFVKTYVDVFKHKLHALKIKFVNNATKHISEKNIKKKKDPLFFIINSMRLEFYLIERVQHRATKMVKGISNLIYEERLNKLKMSPLRRAGGNLI